MKWFVLVTAIVLVAIIFDMSLLVYAAYVLVAVLLLARWVTRQWTDKLATQRHCSLKQAEVGDQVQVTNAIENQGRLPVSWVLVEDVLPPDTQSFKPHKLEVRGKRVGVFRLRPGEKHHLDYQLKCNRRGYYQIGPLLVETGDMFGLFRRFKIATEPSFLVVLPKPVPLEGYQIASRRPIGEIKLTHRLFEDPTRVSGVREYMAGDPLNRVHWQATARTGKLHSKIYEPSTMAGITILLDFHVASHTREHEPFRSEIAITAAASLAHTVFHLGQQTGLVTNGRDAADRVQEEGWRGQAKSRTQARDAVEMQKKSDRLRPLIVPTRQGDDQFWKIMISLARLELTDGLTFPELITESGPRIPRDASVVAIVSRVDEQIAIALGNMVRMGYGVTCLINTYESDLFAKYSGPLLSAGIQTLHLKDEETLATICRQQMVRA